MNRIIIYPYKIGSRSASVLAEALREQGHRCFKVFPDRNFQPRADDLIINWGNSTIPNWVTRTNNHTINMLNDFVTVGRASNKLTAFRAMQDAGVQIPEFTTDGEYAHDQWASGDWGNGVLGRSTLTGHSGAGIDVLDDGHLFNIKDYPLYVKYVKKSAEYRVHVFNGQVIDVQQKKRRNGLEKEEINYQIRVHNNGWVFARDNVGPPRGSVISNSIAAVRSLGLDFGAVDVIWNDHYNSAFVLEVNTAPGLEGSSINNYVAIINSIYYRR